MDDIDRALLSEPIIEPSRNLASTVMREVLLERSVTPRPRFPWPRLLSGAAACLLLALTPALVGVDVNADGWSAARDSLAPARPVLDYVIAVLSAVLAWLHLRRGLLME